MRLPVEIWSMIIWKKRLLEAKDKIILLPPVCESTLSDNNGKTYMWLYRSGNHVWVVRGHEARHNFLSDIAVYDLFYGE